MASIDTVMLAFLQALNLDPAPEYMYLVEIDGVPLAGFTECSGFSARREVIEHPEGGINHYVHKLPGRTTYSNITLRRGITFSIDLWDWYAEGLKDGDVDHRDMTIIQISSYLHLPARWYNIRRAFPVSWTGSDMRADSNQFAVESLELTFDTLEVEDWSIIDFSAKLAKIAA